MILISELLNNILLNRVLLLLIDIFSILLMYWVYSSSPKKKINRLFCLLTVFFLFWINGGYFFSFSNDLNISFHLGRIILGEVALSFTMLYFFLIYFPIEEKRRPILEKFIFLLGISFFFLSVFTTFIIKDIEFTKWGANPIYGDYGKFSYYGTIFFLMILAITQIFKKYFKLTEKQKLKVQYLLIGLLIFVSINLIFNVIFPLIKNSIQYWQIGNYSVIFFLGFTAYAIVKQELFGVKVVLTSIFASLITVLLMIDTIFLTPVLLHQLFKILLLILFIYFGYRLVKSVLDEVQRRKELEDLTLRLEKANTQLKKLDKAKSEFLSIASHQLRTPLAAIKGYISMILDGDYGKINFKTEKAVQNIYNSNERLVKLVNNLLNVSKIESGKIKMNCEKIQLEDVISEAVSELKIKAEEKKLKINWHKPKSALPFIIVDRSRIKQVFLNVIDNAIKYTRKGSISIKAKIQDEKYIIEISDTGRGVPKEDFHRLFDSFTRGEIGFLDHTEGAGLGLYIARKFVEAHKGEISVESQGKNKGSTFYIELPIRK